MTRNALTPLGIAIFCLASIYGQSNSVTKNEEVTSIRELRFGWLVGTWSRVESDQTTGLGVFDKVKEFHCFLPYFSGPPISKTHPTEMQVSAEFWTAKGPDQRRLAARSELAGVYFSKNELRVANGFGYDFQWQTFEEKERKILILIHNHKEIWFAKTSENPGEPLVPGASFPPVKKEELPALQKMWQAWASQNDWRRILFKTDALNIRKP